MVQGSSYEKFRTAHFDKNRLWGSEHRLTARQYNERRGRHGVFDTWIARRVRGHTPPGKLEVQNGHFLRFQSDLWFVFALNIYTGA
jgi:hypothetical protein